MVKLGLPGRSSEFDKNRMEGRLIVSINCEGGESEDRFNPGQLVRYADIEHIVALDPLDEHFRNTRVFGKVLVPALVDTTEKIVVGVLVQGEAAAGYNAPWLLVDPDERQLAIAQDFVDSFVTELKSGALILDVKGVAEALVKSRAELEEDF